MEVLTIDLARKERAVKLRDKDGTIIEGTLIEMDGEARDQYLDQINANARINPTTGQPSGMKTMRGMQARLVVACLALADGTRPNLPTVQKYSATALRALYDACIELNGLDKDAEDRAKNDSSASDTNGTDSPTD